MMSITTAVRHTFKTLLHLLSRTPQGAGSDHLSPGLLSKSHSLDENEALDDTLFPSLSGPCETVYRLNFDSSTSMYISLTEEVTSVPDSFKLTVY